MKKKSIALGVTGSIAAYKAADLCSLLVKNSWDVTVIMTDSAQKLVGPQTFFTLSRNRVVLDLWETQEWKPEHIQLADQTEIFVVAPASANFLGKYANGIADDALSTFALSFDGSVLLAPAMNPRMWKNPSVRSNRQRLEDFGVNFVGPNSGLVACGDEGEGRMAEVQEIYSVINKLASENSMD